MATVAAHAVRTTRVKMAGSEPSSSAPWKARNKSSASGSSAPPPQAPHTPRRVAREHTCSIVSCTIAPPRVRSR
eukprot:6188997-Prymnesium_polylepis.1